MGLEPLPRTLALAVSLLANVASGHDGSHERLARLDQLVGANPDDAWLRLQRAIVRREHGDYGDALADLERARSVAPDLADVDAELARLHFSVHRYSGAAAAADRLVEARPGDSVAYALRAQIRAAVGDHAAAIDDLDRAIELAPAPAPDWYVERARLVAGRGREVDGVAAVRGLDAGLAKIGPAAPLVLEAVELEARYDVDRAIHRLDRWAAGSTRREAWMSLRGDLLLAAGRRPAARDAYEAARGAIRALKPKHRATAATRRLLEHVQERLDGLDGLDAAQEKTDGE